MRAILYWGLTVILTFIGTFPLSAQRIDEEPNLEALYQQIDDAIDHSSQYVAQRLSKIGNARDMLQGASSNEEQLAVAEQLFELYKPFKNDSALYFADLCISLSDSLKLKNKVGLYRSLKAYQCSISGMYVEALDLLKGVDKQVLSNEELAKYYATWMHVYGELGSYSQQSSRREYYFGLQDSYRDSVLAVAVEGSEEFLHLKMDVLCARQLYQDALAVSEKWLSEVTDGTHENAYAAFYRSVVYDKLSNSQQLRYWLGKSALDDIKCAVNDQASLFMLAERLCDDGDFDRAYRYVRFCESCNRKFSPQLRNYQVRYAVNVYNMAYQNAQASYSRLLIVACVAAVLLMAVLGYFVLRLRRQPKLSKRN